MEVLPPLQKKKKTLKTYQNPLIGVSAVLVKIRKKDWFVALADSYTHHAWFQATSQMSLNAGLARDMNNQH